MERILKHESPAFLWYTKLADVRLSSNAKDISVEKPNTYLICLHLLALQTLVGNAYYCF